MANSTITTPSGETVELLDPELLTRGDRNNVVQAGENVAGDFSSGLAALDVLMGKLIVGWSYDLSLPGVSRLSLDALPIKDALFLEQEVSKIQKELFQGTGDPKDEKSFQPPSNG
jgi:hypothetical protein